MFYNPPVFPVYLSWDLNACPPPEDKEPYHICRTVFAAAREQNLFGPAQIRIYYTKNTLPGLTVAKLSEYADAGCILSSSDNEFQKVNAMLVDILLWAINSRKPSNFVVITKIQQDTEYLIRALLSVQARDPSNAFLLLPDTLVPTDLTGITRLPTPKGGVSLKLIDAAPDTSEIKVWGGNLLESILDSDEDSDEGLDERLTQDYVEEEEDEKMDDAVEGEASLSQLWRPTFFSTMGINTEETNTSVLWDVEDYSLPADLTLYAFYENIKCYMKEKAASNGDVIIWAYVPDSMMDQYKTLADEFEGVAADRFIFVPKVHGDKHVRLNQMTVDILLWALDNPRHGTQAGYVPNLLVISKYVEEAKSFFCLMLGGFGVRGYPVFLTLPAADDVPPKYTKEEYVIILPWGDLLSREDSNKRKNLSPPGYPDKRKNVAD